MTKWLNTIKSVVQQLLQPQPQLQPIKVEAQSEQRRAPVQRRRRR